jgi:hypothetical protein
VTRINALPHLDAANYHRSVLHAEDSIWLEKNCYVDIWIEVIHALGLEPRAILPFTAAIDFEGDQWTFFKPPHDELRDLYGIDVQELNVWRPLIDHAVEFLGAGKLISTEADAFWLPDTSGTDYRRQHTKSTVVLADLDLEQRRLGYFHNAGYFMLEGEDFARTFRLDMPADPEFMPLFAESVRIDKIVRRPEPELVELSQGLWRKHLRRLPAVNPITSFQQRFERELTVLHERGLAFYHAWAFATTRQLGASFELGARNLRWLQANGVAGMEESIAAFETIATLSKTFILKGARAVNARKQFDGAQMFGELAAAWERGTGNLASRLR